MCALTNNTASGKFGVLVMRRREDEVWAVLRREDGALAEDDGMTIIRRACDESATIAHLPPGRMR